VYNHLSTIRLLCLRLHIVSKSSPSLIVGLVNVVCRKPCPLLTAPSSLFLPPSLVLTLLVPCLSECPTTAALLSSILTAVACSLNLMSSKYSLPTICLILSVSVKPGWTLPSLILKLYTPWFQPLTVETEYRHGGGIASYIHDSIPFKVLHNDPTIELYIVDLSFRNRCLTLALTYRPPSSNSSVLLHLEDVLDQLPTSNSGSLLILG